MKMKVHRYNQTSGSGSSQEHEREQYTKVKLAVLKWYFGLKIEDIKCLFKILYHPQEHCVIKLDKESSVRAIQHCFYSPHVLYT